jgi:hypothetical protein
MAARKRKKNKHHARRLSRKAKIKKAKGPRRKR